MGCTCWITKFYQPVLARNIHSLSLYPWLSGNPINTIFIKHILDHKGNRKHCIICLCITNTLLRCSESCTVQFPPKNFPRVLITLCTAGTWSQKLWAEQNLCTRAVTPKKQLWLALGDFSKGCTQVQKEQDVSEKSWEWLLYHKQQMYQNIYILKLNLNKITWTELCINLWKRLTVKHKNYEPPRFITNLKRKSNIHSQQEIQSCLRWD